jgi:hypothetical protein
MVDMERWGRQRTDMMSSSPRRDQRSSVEETMDRNKGDHNIFRDPVAVVKSNLTTNAIKV